VGLSPNRYIGYFGLIKRVVQLVALLIATIGYGQVYSQVAFDGQIVDSNTHAPIKQATVRCNDTIVLRSDDNGIVFFSYPTLQELNCVVTCIGYNPYKLRVTKFNPHQTILLGQNSVELQTTVVEAKPKKRRRPKRTTVGCKSNTVNGAFYARHSTEIGVRMPPPSHLRPSTIKDVSYFIRGVSAIGV
jgi:hypothetical protein